MTVPNAQAVLDVSERNLAKVAAFADSMPCLTFAQLVALAGKLDRSRERAAKVRNDAAKVAGLQPDFLAGISETETHLAAMFQLVDAEIERRLSTKG